MNLDRIIAVRNNKTIYREGKKCIKVFDKDYRKSDILNEALNHARIEEIGLKIPKILGITMVDDKWAIETEFVEGKSMAQLMQEKPEKKYEYLSMMVNLQISVQEMPSPLLNDLTDKMYRKISQARIDAATRHMLHTRLEGMSKQKKICHGDFNPSNIILGKEGMPYILDWSHVTQGNSMADAACSYLLFQLSGDAEGAETYLELFCERAGAARQCVEEWLPVVAASQLAKRNIRERGLLMSWVNGTDHK